MDKVIDLTNAKLRKKFIDLMNDHINLYNKAPKDFNDYHANAIDSHITTAYVLGWDDIADKLSLQFSAIKSGRKPTCLRRG